MKHTSDKPYTVFLGDVHGKWQSIVDFCTHHQDFLIVQVGDLGVGFHHPQKDAHRFRQLDRVLKASNNMVVAIRGNHDRPSFFKSSWVADNLLLAADYDLLETKDCGLLQLIGGAISIDRSDRAPGISWWAQEKLVFDPELVVPCDVLVTHVHPSSNPIDKMGSNGMVEHYAALEAMHGEDLLVELQQESEQAQQLSDLSNAKAHVYGHLHVNSTHHHNGRAYHCVNIDSFKEVRI